MLHLRNAEIERMGGGFESWHQSTCRDFSTTECEIPTDVVFSGSVKSWRSGSLAFGDVAAKSKGANMPLIRRQTDIRKDPRDHIMLYVVTKGEIGLGQSGRSVFVQNGDVVLYDQAKPFRIEFIEDARGLVMAIPRAHATTRLGNLTDLTACSIPRQTQAAKFTRSIISQFQPSTDGDMMDISPKMEASALDLIFGSIEHYFQGPLRLSQGHRKDQLRKIKDYLVGNLADTDLSVDTICAVQAISPRSLNRLFSTEGTTPMRWLWQTRLEEAYRRIMRGGIYSITDVAYDTGFTDVSHFSRAFKKAFGQTPSSLLQLR